jgi:hypothetical protein
MWGEIEMSQRLPDLPEKSEYESEKRGMNFLFLSPCSDNDLVTNNPVSGMDRVLVDVPECGMSR